MNQSANHHYVPRAILRNFCFEGESLYYTSKHRTPPTVERRKIDSVFKRRHLNSYIQDDGSRTSRLEEFFAVNFDDKLAQLVRTFELSISSGSLSHLSEDDLATFVQFFYNHIKRTPDFHGKVVEKICDYPFYEKSIASFERDYRPLTPEERAHFSAPGVREKIIEQCRVLSLGDQSCRVLDALAAKKIVLATPIRAKQFVVASNPVVRFLNRPGATLDSSEIELWTTLTPKIAAGLSNAFGDLTVIQLSDDGVRLINSSLVKQSSAFAGSNIALVKSLIRDW